MALVSAGLAYSFSEPVAVTAFGFCAFTSISFAIIFSLISRGAPIQLSIHRSIILLLMFWLFLPALAAIPLIELDATIGWTRAIVDAASQLTTTGAMIADRSTLPRAFEFWQAGLQWMGGYASIVMALLVLAPLNMTAPGVHRSPFLTIEKGNVAGRIGLIAWSMLVVYGGASLVVLLMMIATGTEVYQAILLTMGSISTGGFVPAEASYRANAGAFGIWIGLFAMLFGALGFALHWDVLQRRAKYRKDMEAVGLLVMIFGAGALFWALGQPAIAALQNAISLVTTTAIPMGIDGFSNIPDPVILALVLVGGAAVSTAGGVKIIRFLILFRQTGADLSKLSHPSSTKSVQFKQVTIDPQQMVGLWAYVMGYAAIIAVITITLGLNGVSFAQASHLAIVSISNAGPAFMPDSGLAGDFSALPDAALLLLGLAMALGRIEILAAFAILSPEFWRQ